MNTTHDGSGKYDPQSGPQRKRRKHDHACSADFGSTIPAFSEATHCPWPANVSFCPTEIEVAHEESSPVPRPEPALSSFTVPLCVSPTYVLPTIPNSIIDPTATSGESNTPLAPYPTASPPALWSRTGCESGYETDILPSIEISEPLYFGNGNEVASGDGQYLQELFAENPWKQRHQYGYGDQDNGYVYNSLNSERFTVGYVHNFSHPFVVPSSTDTDMVDSTQTDLGLTVRHQKAEHSVEQEYQYVDSGYTSNNPSPGNPVMDFVDNTSQALTAPPSNDTDMSDTNTPGALTDLEGPAATCLNEKALSYDTCFGAIPNATLIIVRGVFDIFSPNQGGVHELTLSTKEKTTLAYDTSEDPVGFLDFQSSGVLCSMVEKGLHFYARGCINPKSEKMSPKSMKLQLNINIYGLSKDADAIGEYLADKLDIFLQRPSWHDTEVEYKNPQDLVIPEQYMDIDAPLEDECFLKNKVQKAYKLENQWETLWTSQPSVQYSTLSYESELRNVIRTQLQDHQKQAVSFIREKEDEGLYQSVYSFGSTNATPKPRNTSILLADDMGLGKSLTTLAAIACSTGMDNTQNTRRVTLLVAPPSLLSHWKEQIKIHVKKGALNVLLYHGDKRKEVLKDLESGNIDVVLTAYSTLATEYATGDLWLFNRTWFRVVLDEAHFIKDRTTQRSKATCALRTERRWCVTATPIQNKLEDLQGILQFLRHEPFNCPRNFQSGIVRPWKQKEEAGTALHRLRTTLKDFALRRTKEVADLPPRDQVNQEIVLSSEERHIYELCMNDTIALMEGVIRNNITSGVSVLQSILRQRQICNHGTLLLPQSLRKRLERTIKQNVSGGAESTGLSKPSLYCEYCDSEDDALQSPFDSCFHLVCSKCLPQSSLGADGELSCPLCGGEGAGNGKRKAKRQKPLSSEEWLKQINYTGPSTKVNALVSNLLGNRKNQPIIKSVVFSSWTKILSLIELALKDNAISFLRFDGSFPVAQRTKILKTFSENKDVEVLLMSIGSGSVGLNITAASQVHLMEPQWNPMVEEQALNRVHRLGQKKPVKTIRYIVKSSFENTILELQQKKLDLAQASLGSGGIKQRIETIREIFQ